MHRSHGHCMTMGTASTMASMVEALGVGLPATRRIPAVDARRNVLARMAGRRIVEMVKEDVRLSKILTKAAFENAIRANAAIGGSTNAVIHLIAHRAAHRRRARRSTTGIALGDGVHTLVNLMPIGQVPDGGFLLRRRPAGGAARAGRERLAPQGCADRQRQDHLGEHQGRAVLEPRRDPRRSKTPFKKNTGIAVLRGNLCPDGAIIKPSAATPKLLKHRGRAVVFESIEDFHGAHRRPEARHRRELRDGAQVLRAEGLSRHGRGRQHAAAAEAAEERHHRHGAHLGCAHERHRLRHRGAAHLARGGRRRRAGAGARTAT